MFFGARGRIRKFDFRSKTAQEEAKRGPRGTLDNSRGPESPGHARTVRDAPKTVPETCKTRDTSQECLKTDK
eukprot:1024910-Pyramimonas_sp.AAC.1